MVFNGTFSTNRLYRAIRVRDTLCRAGRQETRQTHNLTTKQYTKPKVVSNLQTWLCRDNLLTTTRHPQKRLSSQSLVQLNQNNQETEHIQMQTYVSQKVALNNNKIYSKTYAKRDDRQNLNLLVFFPCLCFITSFYISCVLYLLAFYCTPLVI